jgi:hypothetical protein
MRDQHKTPKTAKKSEDSRLKAVPIKHVFPEGQRSLFSNHITVQHSNEGEFTISFFEVTQPLVLGNPDEVDKQWAGIESATATCLARVVVSAARMPRLIGALITNYEIYEADTGKTPQGDTDSDEKGSQKHAS